LLSPSDFHAIVSGKRKSLSAAGLRVLFRAAEVPYSAAVSWRNRRYDRNAILSNKVGVPVVSVGNLTMGGTGKTPMVEWLAKWFRQRHVRVALISRGYKATEGSRNDEAMELEHKLADVPHLQNPDRVAAASVAIIEHSAELILLDDGFQHRRIHRDLDIVLLDALEPFGFDHVFPRGMLREPLAGLRRADVVCLSRADAVAEGEQQSIKEQAQQHAPAAIWAEVCHRPRSLLSCNSTEDKISLLEGKRVLAFCGLGNPAGFRHTLESCGMQIADFREFPDHHAYPFADVDLLSKWSERHRDSAAIVCTHKDLVKLDVETLGGKPLYALTIGIEFLCGQERLEAELSALIDRIEKQRGS
jgi:tetraacyldisaccharide 4'-kinase